MKRKVDEWRLVKDPTHVFRVLIHYMTIDQPTDQPTDKLTYQLNRQSINQSTY